MGTPTLPQLEQQGRIGNRLEPEHLTCCNLQSPVEDRPNVRPSQAREQVDIGGPWSDPDETDQLAANLIVGPCFETGKVDSPVEDRSGQFSHIPAFLSRETVGPQFLVAGDQDCRRSDVSHSGLKPVERRCSRSQRYLLLEDEQNQGGKARLTVPELGFAETVERSGETVVGACQFAKCSLELAGCL